MSMIVINPYAFGQEWLLNTGNLVYMTSNNAPSPYVASASKTPSAGNPYNAFDSSNTTNAQFNNESNPVWTKMIWTLPIRIVQMIVKVNRSGQPNTAVRVYGIKADLSETLIHSSTITSNTDTTISSSDLNTEFVGVRVEIDGRSDLIMNIYNLRITQWYSK